jgi:hypothetical protein
MITVEVNSKLAVAVEMVILQGTVILFGFVTVGLAVGGEVSPSACTATGLSLA